MAREIPGLANLLNILAQNKAQKASDVRFERQIGLQEQQAEQGQENWLKRLEIEMEQLGMSKKQLQAQLESADVQRQLNELLLAERSDPANKPEASMYRNMYEKLLPNVDPSKFKDGVPAFSATDTGWLDTMLRAQRTKQPESPGLTGPLLSALDPMTTIREEWNTLDPITKQQYGNQFEGYRDVRLPELVPKYNMIAPLYGYPLIELPQQTNIPSQEVVQQPSAPQQPAGPSLFDFLFASQRARLGFQPPQRQLVPEIPQQYQTEAQNIENLFRFVGGK